MHLQMIGTFAGGIGLFLLGMIMMTDGLKIAAGSALRTILAGGTRTPLRGLLSGVVITSLVQSSGAVTVAVIGFANAGLMNLTQTIYVVFGSNIGTTMTSWLVALVGFSFDIKALALPLIGIGMALRLIGRNPRRAALGEALAGFGLFFLGLDILKGSFTDFGSHFDLNTLPSSGVLGVLLFCFLGFLLTFLMQSSSAALALTLTAAATGVVSLNAAAAVVIGANVGTTTTAALAVIGATPNAQRTAAAHVLFNLLTGVVALILLQPLTYLSDAFAHLIPAGQGVAAALAMFHTLFNIMGVALLWPFTGRLVKALDGRFVPKLSELGRTHYLDRNVLSTPSLAFDALVLESSRIGGHARDMARSALSASIATSEQTPIDMQVVNQLQEAINAFTVQMQRLSLPSDVVEALPNTLRATRYFRSAANLALQIAAMQSELEPPRYEPLATQLNHFRREAVQLFANATPLEPGFNREGLRGQLTDLEAHYQNLKAQLLRAGTEDRVRVPQMVTLLDLLSAVHRMAEQMVKGSVYLYDLWQLAERHRHEAAA